MGDEFLILKFCYPFLKSFGKVMGILIFAKFSALLNDSVSACIAHKKSLIGFFLFKTENFREVIRKGGKQGKIIFDIGWSAEGIFCQQDRKLCLNPQIGTKRLLQHIAVFAGKLCGKMQTQYVIEDLIFR